jgi:hypothetical protein
MVKIKNPGRRCSMMTRNVRQLIPLSVFSEGHDDIPMDEAEIEAAIIAEALTRGPGPCTLKNKKETPKVKKEMPKLPRVITTKKVKRPREVVDTTIPINTRAGARTRSRANEEKKDATSSIVLTVGPGAIWTKRWNEMSGAKEVTEAEVLKIFNHPTTVTQEEPKEETKPQV